MNGSTLSPPNHHLLSDSAIFAVTKNPKRDHDFGDREARNTVSDGYNRLQDDRYLTASAHRGVGPTNPMQINTYGVNAAAPASERSREEESNNVSLIPRCHQAGNDVLPASHAVLKADADQAWIAELIRLDHDINRKKNREKQRRYVKKQKCKLAYLETFTAQLRVEVAKLELKRNNIVAGSRKRVNMWHVAVEYLWLFRHDLDLGGLEKMANYSLTTTTQTALTITEQTLQKLFPHLSTATEDDCAHKLANKLVGQRITMKGSVYFEFDELSGYVTRISAQSDMLTPLLQLLGSLADVAFVFEKALISPSLQWKPSIIT